MARKIDTPAEVMEVIYAKRVAAGQCRHCGGPVPCWSIFGDVEVGVAAYAARRPKKTRKQRGRKTS